MGFQKSGGGWLVDGCPLKTIYMVHLKMGHPPERGDSASETSIFRLHLSFQREAQEE